MYPTTTTYTSTPLVSTILSSTLLTSTIMHSKIVPSVTSASSLVPPVAIGVAITPGDHDFNSPSPDQDSLTSILVSVTVIGWLVFGIIIVICTNSRGRAGCWVPEWYLDCQGTRKDKAAVAAWWIVITLFWPVLGPVLAARKCGKFIINRTKRKAETVREHSEK
ncbi:Fc.00g043940.m01.CDS01 [Cosmosporella sp. VM-42]